MFFIFLFIHSFQNVHPRYTVVTLLLTHLLFLVFHVPRSSVVGVKNKHFMLQLTF